MISEGTARSTPPVGARFVITRLGALAAIKACEGLLQAHFEEVAKFQDLYVLNPDLKRYEQMDQAGRFIGLLAYAGDELVGYSATFLVHNLHYVDTLMAQNDVLYVKPEHRRSRAGAKLMLTTEEAARAAGAKIMVWHSKENTALDTLLERRNYEILDILRAKRL